MANRHRCSAHVGFHTILMHVQQWAFYFSAACLMTEYAVFNVSKWILPAWRDSCDYNVVHIVDGAAGCILLRKLLNSQGVPPNFSVVALDCSDLPCLKTFVRMSISFDGFSRCWCCCICRLSPMLLHSYHVVHQFAYHISEPVRRIQYNRNSRCFSGVRKRRLIFGAS